MKKLFKALAILIACMVASSSAFGCAKKPDVGVDLDDSKKTIIISVFGGGFGTSWAVEMCNAWNKSEEGKASDYQFTLLSDSGHLDTNATIKTYISSNATQADIFFTDDCDMTKFTDDTTQDKLLDLTDVWNAKPDAQFPDRKVRDKFYFVDELESVWTSSSGAKLSIPYTMGTSGIVYDRDLFETMGWYFTDNTTANGLSKGMDGVEGTYDDGLPVTVSDFETLLSKITNRKLIPFVIYGDVASAGTDHVINAIWAQYEGVESFVNGFDYSGEIYRANGNFSVTPETGYQIYQNAEGRTKGVKFVEDYIIAKNLDKTYKYLYSDSSSLDHKESESTYIYSHDPGPQIAMTINGAWWENEARGAFDEEKRIGNPGYGERNYGFMPVPILEGQNPASNKTVFSVNNFGSVFAVKSNDSAKNEAIKSFLTFYSSNAGLNIFTKKVGVAPGYKFEIDDTVLSNLTKFGKIYYEICNSEHVEIVAPTVFRYLSPINYKSTNSPKRNKVTVNSYDYTAYEAMNAISNKKTATEVIELWANEFNENTWATLVNSVMPKNN